jgi:hypothetical protein
MKIAILLLCSLLSLWGAYYNYEKVLHRVAGDDVVYDPKDPSNGSLAATATDAFGIVIFLVVVAIGFVGLAIIAFFSYSTGPRGSLRKPWA